MSPGIIDIIFDIVKILSTKRQTGSFFGDMSLGIVARDRGNVVDEDDDIIDDEYALPHALVDSDDEDLINVDDDSVDKVYSNVVWLPAVTVAVRIVPLHTIYPPVAGVASLIEQMKTKALFGWQGSGLAASRDKTQNLSLKEITDKKGLVPIRFEVRDKQALMPIGDDAAHWSSYIGEVIRGVPLYYPSWLKVPKERKAALITDIGTGTYNVEKIRRARPEAITAEEWDKYIQFWNDPKNISRAAQNRQNRAKSTVISLQGSRSLARLRDEMAELTTQEYPSLIDTYFVAHTVKGVFTRDEDHLIYFESAGASGSGGSDGCGDDEESADDEEDEDGDGDIFLLYSYEYVFKHIFGELRKNVVDEDDDIVDDKDALPHDLADSDDEDLINVDDDSVDKVYSSEEED
nr:hypothetical protein [Tanacetum cinerariifolium]